MFLDEARIEVHGGRGGNGAVSFRREKFVPRGGPDGGDGGRGGHILLLADPNLTTLIDFKYRTRYRAPNGEHGSGGRKRGKDGADLILRVPVGTLVYEEGRDTPLADLAQPGQTFLAARGGRGGRGNAAFATPTHQTPRFAEKGEPGESRVLRLELKLLADVGLVGYPNVGKSTLIARVSAARPKIADYPFTTLVPNLGVVRLNEETSFVMADIPGLIEGAHEGAGLGHQFLRHIERTRVLIHLLDVSGYTDRDPLRDFQVINRELELHNPRLAQLPQLVALNKIDSPLAKDLVERVRPPLEEQGYKVFPISALTGEGVEPLLWECARLLQQREEVPLPPEEEVVVRFTAPSEREWEVRREGPHLFVVKGAGVERMVSMTDLESEEALLRLHRRLERLGVLEALREAGIQEGDTVRIGDFEFDYIEEYHPLKK